MILLDVQIGEPDRYFWYLLALGSCGLLLKMINMHMGKVDKTLEALQKLVSALYEWKAGAQKEIDQNSEDIKELKEKLDG